MKFFSGFCLSGESKIFNQFLDQNDFTIAGFSLGAIDAIEYLYKNRNMRVDKLQLFSPAFFHDKDRVYKRVQLINFKKNEQKYIENFLENISFPSDIDMKSFYKKESIYNLERLLNYEYSEEILYSIKDRGVKIEVYLGTLDKIIDYKQAEEFFKKFATIFILKKRGHILHG